MVQALRFLDRARGWGNRVSRAVCVLFLLGPAACSTPTPCQVPTDAYSAKIGPLLAEVEGPGFPAAALDSWPAVRLC